MPPSSISGPAHPVSRRRFLQAAGAGAGALWLGNRLLPARRCAAEGPEVRSGRHDDPDLHLFVDDEEIEKVENLLRTLNRPRKQPAPVLVADRPWEGERAQ